MNQISDWHIKTSNLKSNVIKYQPNHSKIQLATKIFDKNPHNLPKQLNPDETRRLKSSGGTTAERRRPEAGRRLVAAFGGAKDWAAGGLKTYRGRRARRWSWRINWEFFLKIARFSKLIYIYIYNFSFSYFYFFFFSKKQISQLI